MKISRMLKNCLMMGPSDINSPVITAVDNQNIFKVSPRMRDESAIFNLGTNYNFPPPGDFIKGRVNLSGTAGWDISLRYIIPCRIPFTNGSFTT